MQLSAEIRWFWPDSLPEGLSDWFRSGSDVYCGAGGGISRVDTYLRDPNGVELGVKHRGSKLGVEVKGLVEVRSHGLNERKFLGPVEIWAKWTSKELRLHTDSTLAVRKVRWLRKFDTTGIEPIEIALDANEQPVDGVHLPAMGCNVEMTEVTLNETIWWTLGFESFGSLATLEANLYRTASVLADRRPPKLQNGILASYPLWLARHVNVS